MFLADDKPVDILALNLHVHCPRALMQDKHGVEISRVLKLWPRVDDLDSQ